MGLVQVRADAADRRYVAARTLTSQFIKVPFGTPMLAANGPCNSPALALMADTFTDRTWGRRWRIDGSSEPEKVTVTFRGFMGFLWRFITGRYLVIGTTSMA